MDEEFPALNPKKFVKTYGKLERAAAKSKNKSIELQTPSPIVEKREPLTTKNAVKFLLEGSLSSKVCRYCLNVATELSELDLILQVADRGAFYKVSLKDMIASFHPFKVIDDPNFPNKICNKCIDRTISSYLFTQQCERAERALRNCFEDMYEKLEKLDPLERTKKRGRQKLHPNFNILHAEHEKVINYADPIMHIVNTATEPFTAQSEIQQFECLKCCEILPNMESLLNHTTIHPKSMWFNCRLCGKSFVKLYQLKKHFRHEHIAKDLPKPPKEVRKYDCKRCGVVSDTYYEYLQHIEKHKFKMVMEHVVERKMDKLCSICFGKGTKLVSMDKTICLHGGCPELTGDRPLYNILASTLPEMNILDNYMGTKICEKCLSHAITSYVFVNQIYFVRSRLNTCVSVMLDSLDKITEPKSNICIEIAQSAIMNVTEPFDETLLLNEDEDIDEAELKVDVLEDEFRVKSEDESETDAEAISEPKEVKEEPLEKSNCKTEENNTENRLVNGYRLEDSICSEFLTFKKKKLKPSKPKFTCPLCNKHFISDYFLKRHIMKHVPKKVECNICNLLFKSKFDLYEHKKMTHLLNKCVFLCCKICGRCYTNEEKLKLHIKLHKNQFCQLCDKVFKSQNHYNDHMQRHMHKLGVIMKKYTQNCSFCEKDCPNDNEFTLHVNKVHLQIKPYSCDMCERQFYTDYNLRSHQKVHSARCKEQCHFCSKILNSRKQLVIHIRKHIGETPFFCQICNQTFYSQCKLRKHMKMYHGGKFCCKFCKTAFVTKKELKEHSNKTHNNLF